MTYNDYKPTGLPWAYQIPAHWEFMPNGSLLKWKQNKVGERYTEYDLLSLTTTGIKKKDINDVRGKVPTSYEGYQSVDDGDMVFCLFDLDCSAVFSGKSPCSGMITSAYDVACPKGNRINASYLDYWFRFVFSGRYYKMYSKSVRFTINWDIFKSLKTPVPPRAEQDKIVHYLDWQVSKINRLIAAKKKKIALLKEQLTQQTSEIVYKGIDDTPLKDVVTGLMRKAIEENSSMAQDQDEFEERYKAYEDRYDALQIRMEMLQQQKPERQDKAEEIRAFMTELKKREEPVAEFDDLLWLAVIDKVTVNHDGTLVFRFKNWTEVVG